MANYYWNEEYLLPYIIEYQKADEEEKKRIYEQHLHEPLLKMAKAQINTHKFYIWEPYDDLISISMDSAYTAIKNFKPYITKYETKEGKKTYYSAFNYFSLTMKKAMKYYTIRMQKHRKNKDIDDAYHIHHKEKNYDLMWYDYIQYTDRFFHEEYANRHDQVYERYHAIWEYIKSQDHHFSRQSKQQYFKHMRAKFPDEHNALFRNILNFMKKALLSYNKE